MAEQKLREIIERALGPTTPPRLREAIRYAVFPGGARLRPRLCIAVATACGANDAPLEHAAVAASAVELIHSASLVHDDLPCFDGALERRGRPTVHERFGETTAVLVGDALIVLAFEALAQASPRALALLATATGPARGIIAGQAWEDETSPPLEEYHRAKTAALFEAAAGMGALVAGAPDVAPWERFGEAIGRAYQAADDLDDARSDGALGKPNVVTSYGVAGALASCAEHLADARARIPRCANDHEIVHWLEQLALSFERHNLEFLGSARKNDLANVSNGSTQ